MVKSKEKHKNQQIECDHTGQKSGPVPVIYGWWRIVVTFIIAGIAIYYRLTPMWRSNNKSDMPLATWNNTIGTAGITTEIPCSSTHVIDFTGCSPSRCGRFITDGIVSKEETQRLIGIAEKCMSLAGGSGGATILDLHSGAITYGTQFADVRILAKKKGVDMLLTKEDLDLYTAIKERIKGIIERKWKIQPGNLKLTKPTFFSRMTSKPPATLHDEYWHTHTDIEQYEKFHYTSLLYLNTHTHDFEGGEFVFDTGFGTNHTIQPKAGRVSVFTSGKENPHHVERVTSGVRYAITIPFTCDPVYSIGPPKL